MSSKLSDDPPNLLIGRDRTFYSGTLGNSRKMRRLGAFTIYLADGEDFDISINYGPWQRQPIAALMPFTQHRIYATNDRIILLHIECESVPREVLAALLSEVNGGQGSPALQRHIHAAHAALKRSDDASGFSTAEFDHRFLGRSLSARTIDPEIERMLERSRVYPDLENRSATKYAQELDISTSWFLHLFKVNTDSAFRSHRAWKRARRYIGHAPHENSLTKIALDLGYPDSSHFSRSIRQTFGLQPRSIRRGLQQLRIFVGDHYQLSVE